LEGNRINLFKNFSDIINKMFDFLNLTPEHFGIDISDLSLKIVKLKKKRGSFVFSSFGERDIPKGVISSGEIKDEAILTKLIRDAVKDVNGEKIKTKYVVASLPEEKSYLQVIQYQICRIVI